MSLSTAELRGFAARLAAQPELWSELVRHDPELRLYEQIWDDEDVNAWLICWSSGQDTGFHDHDDSAAAISVVAGEVLEERLRVGGPAALRRVETGTTVHVPRTAIHRVRHTGSEPAVTIHAYSPPLRRTGSYRVAPDGGLERASQPYEQELRPMAAAAGGRERR